jgi:crotonobetainyl-CoA:carnitine CoA-transferase CaiB-like acyl-CoA transferase
VSLNLKSERGVELLKQMVSQADVLLENFAPGTTDRLGIGPEAMLKLNPKLIYASGTGYGSFGPYRDRLAMDLTVQAMSGVMATTGFADRPPVKTGPAVCDFFAGIHLYGAVVTALFQRERTGRGSLVEVSMLESVYPSLSSSLGLYYGAGETNPPRTGNRHGGLAEAPYNVYPVKDGWIALLCVSERHWASLLRCMGREDLQSDSRFGSLQARVDHIDVVDDLIGGWTEAFTKDELVDLLAANRIPCAPVREVDEVVNDPHMHARGTLRNVAHPELGDIVLPTGAMLYRGSRDIELAPSKALGADNGDIFGKWLGLSADEIAQLARDEVI